MKTNKQKRREVIVRNPLCGLLKRDLQKKGIEVQTWGLDANHNLVYAGVHFVPELTAKWLYRLHNRWARWRKWYDNLPENLRRDYPAKHDCAVSWTGAHPIDNPKQVSWLSIAITTGNAKFTVNP